MRGFFVMQKSFLLLNFHHYFLVQGVQCNNVKGLLRDGAYLTRKFVRFSETDPLYNTTNKPVLKKCLFTQ